MSLSLDTEKKLQQFFSEIEYHSIFDLNINYLKEAIALKLISVNNDELIKINIMFKQVMSYYVYQEPEYDTYRLNNFDEASDLLLTESSYFPQGFGKIKIESLDNELKEIETLSSNTNFYFQVNNKDYFFIEANSVSINGKEYRNLIVDENVLKKPLD